MTLLILEGMMGEEVYDRREETEQEAEAERVA